MKYAAKFLKNTFATADYFMICTERLFLSHRVNTEQEKTSLKVNSVLERESSQPISTSILSNNFRNIKSVLFWDDFQLLTKLSKAIKIRANQFIFTKSEKI